MSWLSRFLPKRAPEQKSLDEALLEILGGATSTAAGVNSSAANCLRAPAVGCAVRAIAEAVACLPVTISPDHPANGLLSTAWNSWTSAFDGLLRS